MNIDAHQHEIEIYNKELRKLDQSLKKTKDFEGVNTIQDEVIAIFNRISILQEKVNQLPQDAKSKKILTQLNKAKALSGKIEENAEQRQRELIDQTFKLTSSQGLKTYVDLSLQDISQNIATIHAKIDAAGDLEELNLVQGSLITLLNETSTVKSQFEQHSHVLNKKDAQTNASVATWQESFKKHSAYGQNL
jgi:hypothetical protein